MGKRHVLVTIAAIVSIAGWSMTAAAELNLWVSYHYAGEGSYGEADFADAEKLLVEAGPETEKPWRDAYTLNALGMVYAAQGNFKQAERCYICALRLLEDSLGKYSRDVPMVLNNLADLYFIAGDKTKVEPLYRRALCIHERDQLNVEVCHSLNGMALLHNDRQEYVQAEKLLKRAIDIHDRSQRREHPYVATVLVNLGALFTNLERFDEAEPLFERAEYVQSRVLRPDHPDVAIRLHAYAGLLAKTGRMDAAREATALANEIQAKQAEKEPIALLTASTGAPAEAEKAPQKADEPRKGRKKDGKKKPKKL